jgi:hypothetical protein
MNIFSQWLFQAIQGPGLFIQFRSHFSQPVDLLEQVISPKAPTS